MKKVLIVEPSRSFAQFLKYMLTRLGYEVTHVVSAKEAFENITTILPDFIICEAQMKDMSGMDVCTEIGRGRYGFDIPVAIVSIDGTMETRQIAQKAGCVDYLTKPVTAKAIHELMERHLPYNHKRRNLRAKMTFKAMVDDGTRKMEMRAITIGEGGMYLCTEQPFEVGLKIDIDLQLPGLLAPITIKGEVIYQAKGLGQEMPKGIGVKFIGLDHNTVTLLRHYIESYLSNFLPESSSE